MKKKLILTLTISLSILLLGSSAFATVAPKVAPKVVVKVVPKVIPLVYTYESVYANILKANVGPNVIANVITYEDNVVRKQIIYNFKGSDIDTSTTAFRIHSAKGILPNMDMKIISYARGNADVKKMANLDKAYNVLDEAMFPKQGKIFDTMISKVKLRVIKKGYNQEVDLPTVLFLGGRRVFVTPRQMHFSVVYVSAINDKTDIWKELESVVYLKNMNFTRAELKKHMPELKNY